MEHRSEANGRTTRWACAAALAACGVLCAPQPSRAGQEGPGGLAGQLLRDSGVRGGLVVHVGCGEGELTAALHAGESYLVHGLAADPAQVAEARRRIHALGLYGKVSVAHWSPPALPYADNLVNLLVWEGPGEADQAELLRVLAPNGAAWVKRQGAWTKLLKPRSGEIDDWPHFLHGPDNNPVAADRVAGPPRHVQWVCGPAWSKHHEKYPPTVPVLVSAGGRVFYIEDETPPSVFNVKTSWQLKARDAFNGVPLWQRAMPEWDPETWPGNLGGWGGGPVDYRRRLVAAADRLYVTLSRSAPVVALDAATGREACTFGAGGEATEVLLDGPTLYVSQRADRKPQVAAYEAQTGRRLWSVAAGDNIAVREGKLFFLAGAEVGALSASTGEELWRARPLEPQGAAKGKAGAPDRKGDPRGAPSLQGPLLAGPGVVLVCPGDRGGVVALSAETGKTLWRTVNQGFRPWFKPVNAHIIDGLVWVSREGDPDVQDLRQWFCAVGLDPLTGTVKRSVPAGQAWNSGHHQRCYPSKATDRYMVYSRRGADFLDLDTGEVTLHNWTRGTCTYGLMLCNGLVYSPPHACRCYSEAALRGLHAFAAARQAAASTPDREPPRLEKGPAYAEAAPQPAVPDPQSTIRDPQSEDWPTYRHDAARSGRTSAAVPADLAVAWRADVGGRLSGLTVADGKLFVAAVDAHTVHALDAATGAECWRFTAGGRVDGPPTLSAGLAVFGCADGWVYCLRAADGRLAWRFRAAPAERLVGAWGQVESAWPVHGSVLVRDGVAYFAAGRNTYVDGGLYVYGLDLATGAKRHEHRLHGPFTGAGMTRENPGRGFTDPGCASDVLSADADRLYMRHMAFDPTLRQAVDMNVNYWPTDKRSGEEFGGDHKYWCDIMEAPRLALRSDPNWYHRSYFYQWPGRRLYSTTGLLDDSWHIRSYWSYGQVTGQYLVFDGEMGYAVKAYPNAARWLAYNAGEGYTLYAGKTGSPPPGGDAKLFALRPQEFAWSAKVPLRPQAMVLAKGTLLLAGVPDLADPAEALAAFQARRGALLWAVSAGEGRKLAEIRLPAPPVFDGMAAAAGRLYLAAVNGQVLCLSGGK